MKVIYKNTEINDSDFEDFHNIILNISEENECYQIEITNTRDSLTFLKSGIYFLIRFMNNSFKPPYYSAANYQTNFKIDEYFEFNEGGTTTPVPANRCINFDETMKIAHQFYSDGTLACSVAWLED
jgi:hypothetical protein